MGWNAVTETGTKYSLRHNLLQIESSRFGVSLFSLWQMKSNANPLNVPSKDDTWRDVETPVIGERLYVSGKDEWRISTIIVSCEIVADDTR